MIISDYISESLGLKILKFFDADLDKHKISLKIPVSSCLQKAGIARPRKAAGFIKSSDQIYVAS
jgi:hypothetical protein